MQDRKNRLVFSFGVFFFFFLRAPEEPAGHLCAAAEGCSRGEAEGEEGPHHCQAAGGRRGSGGDPHLSGCSL